MVKTEIDRTAPPRPAPSGWELYCTVLVGNVTKYNENNNLAKTSARRPRCAVRSNQPQARHAHAAHASVPGVCSHLKLLTDMEGTGEMEVIARDPEHSWEGKHEWEIPRCATFATHPGAVGERARQS